MNRCDCLVIAVLAAAASGCASRMPYQAPAPAIPSAWSGAGTASDQPQSVDENRLARWWESFSDAELTSLVERAVAGSPDVRTAASRLRESRATLASTRSTLKPTFDLAPSVAASRNSGETGPSGFTSVGGGLTRLYDSGFDSSWEADVFGGIRSSIDAGAATTQVRDADLQDVLVSLAAEVALDYINVRSLQQRVAIANANVGAQQQALDLTQLREEAGLATDLDVQQARSNVESTRAQIAALDSQRAQAIHALAVLIGRPPAALDQELSEPGDIPKPQLSLAIGIPADALRRRPDVRSAERQVASQSAQIDVARADLRPSLRLAGSIGLESLAFARLFVPGASFFNVRPTGNLRVFNREQLRQNVVVQAERQQQAAATYETRVLAALQEVEDALTGFAQEQTRRDHLEAAATAAKDAADLSLQLYTAGLRDFRDVLDAQRSLLTIQDSLASSTANVSGNLVRVYKAVGGGWATSSMVAESD
jgi:NodT family efflux transporter outer membrane factor (OMF) lipoprotein